MIRSTLIAAVFGVSAAALALYLLTTPARQDPAAASTGADSAVVEEAIPAEAKPISSSMGSMGESEDWEPLDQDFAAGNRVNVDHDWNHAIETRKHPG